MSVPAWATGHGRPSIAAQRLASDGALLALGALWLLASRGADPGIAPDPGAIAGQAVQLFGDPGLARHTYSSLARVLVAVLVAVTLGTGLMIAARFLYLTRILIARRILPLLNAVPTVSWAILAVVWFGVNDVAVIVVIVAILLPSGLNTAERTSVE